MMDMTSDLLRAYTGDGVEAAGRIHDVSAAKDEVVRGVAHAPIHASRAPSSLHGMQIRLHA